MSRAASIEALLKKAKQDLASLKTAYETSLHEKHVRDDLKVTIKNIFENLRSCLDYLAQDIFESYCRSSKKPSRLYFPIRETATEFSAAIVKDYPGLSTSAKNVVDTLEAVQPYRDPWLGQFNKLNNHNKHQELVEQTRTETRTVKVSGRQGSVTWGPGVKFGGGVKVIGVPIDPRTQMPVPNTVTKTEVITWIDFRFKDVNESVLAFVNKSVQNIEGVFQKLRPHLR
jgi:hypothetical protein